jgi:FKBP-type peptidyl-prolyl cis-trans isomerase FklB
LELNNNKKNKQLTMKKVSIILIAAMAMISCGNVYTGKTMELTNLNDSMNYALGLVNGAQLKMYQLRNDSSIEAVTEFVDALQRGYDGEIEVLSEAGSIGRNIGQSIKKSEETGLANNSVWAINQKIFFQGLVNGLRHDTTVMKAADARNYFQAQYQASATLDDSVKIGKVVKGKCIYKVKTITLKNQSDSINYAFGYMNGEDIYRYVLLMDTTGQLTKDLIVNINKGLKMNVRNPQLVNMGEQIGKNIKAQEAEGLIGEPSLVTDFMLIKQGFINGLLGYEEQMDGTEAGEYIQNTMNYIKYGNVKEDGEKFLTENALKEGVKVTESGLQYEVLKMGKGKKPSATDKVKVHYHGTLIDGTVFDSSVERGEPTSFGLNQVIKGWTEGLQLMPVGSKFRFYIPQELGYGAQQAGSIPPYSTLIFEVELLSIEK